MGARGTGLQLDVFGVTVLFVEHWGGPQACDAGVQVTIAVVIIIIRALSIRSH